MINMYIKKMGNKYDEHSVVFAQIGWITEEDFFNKGLDNRIIGYENDNVQNFGINSRVNVYTAYHQEWDRVVRNVDVIKYYKEVSNDHQSITMKEQIVGGMPAVKGSRIPISLIVSCLRDGMSIEEVCEDYGLTVNEVKDSLDFVVDLLNRPFHEESNETFFG